MTWRGTDKLYVREGLAFLAIVLAGVWTGACGSNAQPHRQRDVEGIAAASTASDEPRNRIDDGNDDEKVRHYGHEVEGAQRNALVSIVKRYYTVAAADDGASACRMLIPSLVHGIPEDLGHNPGPPSLRGNTCAVVTTKLFRQQHKQLTKDLATMKVYRVRKLGNEVRMILAFGSQTEPREVSLARVGTVWRIAIVEDVELP